MGQKVNPNIIRLGITGSWQSNWFSKGKTYSKQVIQDIRIREMVRKAFQNSGISRIEIERSANKVTLNIYTSRPGVLIGKQGAAIQEFKTKVENKFQDRFDLNIKEIKKPYLDAYIVAEMIGQQISKRFPFRRAAKSAIEKVMESGAKGVKVLVGGRLNGVEISRSEAFLEGKIPLQTFRADIDYAHYEAPTTYGIIGVKVWIYKGEKFDKKQEKERAREKRTAQAKAAAEKAEE